MTCSYVNRISIKNNILENIDYYFYEKLLLILTERTVLSCMSLYVIICIRIICLSCIINRDNSSENYFRLKNSLERFKHTTNSFLQALFCTCNACQ